MPSDLKHRGSISERFASSGDLTFFQIPSQGTFGMTMSKQTRKPVKRSTPGHTGKSGSIYDRWREGDKDLRLIHRKRDDSPKDGGKE